MKRYYVTSHAIGGMFLSALLVLRSAVSTERVKEFIGLIFRMFVSEFFVWSFNVILIAGQSNTHAGIGFNSNLDSPVSEIKQLGRFGEDNMRLIEAKEPLQHHTAENNKIGFGLTYAKLLFEYLNEDKKIYMTL